MKKLIPVLMILCLGLAACNKPAATDAGAGHGELIADSASSAEGEEAEVALPDPDATGNFGAAVTAEGAIPAKDLLPKLKGQDSIRVKITGDIASCCQAKGCWMKMPIAADQEMTVKFKDYAFFVPKNSAGKNAVMEGWAYKELVSVDELRHFAEDAGKSKEEIAKITKPEERITFMADGVLIAPSAEGAH
jgi:predicted small secreted protein